MEKKAIIVGDGFAGLTVAMTLLQKGWSTTIIGPDRKEGVASYAATGLSVMRGHQIGRSAHFATQIKGQKELKVWIQTMSDMAKISIPQVWGQVVEPTYDGVYCRKSKRAYGFSSLRSVVSQSTSREQAEKSLCAREIQALHALISSPDGYLQFPTDGWFDATSLMNVMRSNLKSHPQCLYVKARASGLEQIAGQAWKVRLHDQTDLVSSYVVIAAGEESVGLLNSMGCQLQARYQPAATIKVQVMPKVTGDLPKFMMKSDRDSIVIKDGGLIFGSVPCGQDRVVKDQLERQADLLRQKLGGYQVESKWGVRLYFPGFEPKVERVTNGLFYFGGFHKNVYHLAVPLAQSLVEHMQT